MIAIIAEIGWNHCGDMNLAKQMAKAAQENGATYAKYQTWSVDRLKPGSWDDDGRRQIYEKAELSKNDHIELINYCNQIGIKFLSSVFSISDAKLLVELGCKEVKIPSFESRNHKLIQFCGENFQTVFMSTGTSTLDEIQESLNYFGSTASWHLMHCVSTYPCDYSIANLPKMIELKNIHNQVGYSDHIQGIESAKIAIGYGAKVIEKHFTIDNNLPGRDNKFAILPEDLFGLSKYIHYIHDMMINHGNGYNKLEQDSRKNYEGRFNG
jgi:N,N'-diacetyllegionaminate synthase|tara:strand:- start:5410 stop:6213 length:804 start_codon:yes stop_codon:yes gene_type:complete